MLFVGDDWAEDHHDVEIVNEQGRRRTWQPTSAKHWPAAGLGFCAHEVGVQAMSRCRGAYRCNCAASAPISARPHKGAVTPSQCGDTALDSTSHTP